MVDASIESYYAFDPHDPARFDPQGITPPPGYDLVDCWTGIDTIGDAYLIAFYNKNAGWLDPRAKFYDHQALNYQAALACAFASSDTHRVGDVVGSGGGHHELARCDLRQDRLTSGGQCGSARPSWAYPAAIDLRDEGEDQ
jgi:hypothetical protein